MAAPGCENVVMSSAEDNPFRQFAAAWQATAAIAAEWAQRTTAITSEAFRKLASDPAIRAVLDTWRITVVWDQRQCECECGTSHPDDVGICDQDAVITRRLAGDGGDAVEVPLCAPCAVAQGVAELPR